MDRQSQLVNDTKIVVSRVPFRCVVCNGWGTVSNLRVPCKACAGSGFLLVDQPKEEESNYGKPERGRYQ